MILKFVAANYTENGYCVCVCLSEIFNGRAYTCIMSNALHSNDRKAVVMTVFIFFSRLVYVLLVRRNSTHL